MEITSVLARRCLEVVDQGLSHGLGNPKPGEMCVEAAICYALDLPHGDDPGCVAPALRRLKIALNDRKWSSKSARAKGLRRLALAQLGSKGALDEQEFIRRVVDVTIRKVVPIGLRAAIQRNPKHADALEAAAVRCEQEGTREACQAARSAAYAAADAAAYAADAAAYAAYAAAYAAADAAAYAAADAAAYAADAAAYAAYAAAYAAAAYAAAARDIVLFDYAEWIVQILIDMQAPGCQWLHLTEGA